MTFDAGEAVIIANPAARGMGGRGRLERFVALLAERGLPVEVRWTRGPGFTADDLDLDGGAGLVIAAGGDGTLHQVVNALLLRGERRTVGFFPAGTANVFAHEAGLPRGEEELADLMLGAAPREYLLGWGSFDAGGGSAQERFFLLMAGVGWDARVTMAVEKGAKRRHGRGAYFLAGMRLILSGKREPLTVRAGGRELEGEMAVVADSPFYGGPFSLAPSARVDGPRFTVAVVRRIGLGKAACLTWRALRRRHDPSGNVVYLEAGEVEVPTPGIPIQMDGEHVGFTPALFRKGSRSVPVVSRR